MTATSQPQLQRRAAPLDLDDTTSLVLVDLGGRCGFTLLRRRRCHAVVAVLLRRFLDRRLAAGEAPENSRLLAVRAGQLMSCSTRLRLAQRWDSLAVRARQEQARNARFHARPALDSDVADHFERVADTLRSDRPVFAQGVAIAATMRSAASAVLPRLRFGGNDLAAAIARHAISAMSYHAG